MNENSSRMVGRWMDFAASSGDITPPPTMAIAPSSATPVRSRCSLGRPPRIMPR
ncbi:MAG: hypothetical protein RL456_1453 [Pseudomonadota bacterium]|jgi:hypothetical protein